MIRAAFVRQSRGNLEIPTAFPVGVPRISIPTAFEVHSSCRICGNLSTENIELDSHGNRHAFEVHSGRSCILVGTFQLHSSRIRAAIEGQSKDSDGIRSAFQLDSLST